MGALKNIRNVCELLVAGGLPNKIYITKTKEVTAIAAVTANTDEIAGASAFTMATSPAGTWKVIEVSKVTSKKSLKSTSEGDADTKTIKTVYTGFIPGIRKNSELAQLNGCEWLAIVPDNNGNRRLLGDLIQGCTIKVDEEIAEGVNGYPIEITVDGKNHYPYFLADNVTITEAADA